MHLQENEMCVKSIEEGFEKEAEKECTTQKDNVTEKAAQKPFLLSLLPFFAIIENLLRESKHTRDAARQSVNPFFMP